MAGACELHTTEVRAGSLLAELSAGLRLGVNSTHHQVVDQVAKPFEVIARAPDGIIEALGLTAAARPRLPFLFCLLYTSPSPRD